MACAFVHGLEKLFESLGKSLVALGTTETARLLEIRLGKTARRTLCVRAADGQCEVKAYAGQPHGFFNSRTQVPELGRSPFEDTLAGALAFLDGLGWR